MTLHILTASSEVASLTLMLDGQLNAVTAPALEQLITHLDARITTLILDLSRLSFVSSAGLRVFAKTRRTMQSREGKLGFVNLSPQVQKVFDIVKVVPPSEIFCNEEELDSYLACMQDEAN